MNTTQTNGVTVAQKACPGLFFVGAAAPFGYIGEYANAALFLLLAAVCFGVAFSPKEFWVWLQNTCEELMHRARPSASHAASAAKVHTFKAAGVARKTGKDLSSRGWAYAQKAPVLVGAVSFLCLCVFFFGKAYIARDWDYFHLGLVFGAVSSILFIVHFEWTEKIWGNLSKNWAVWWLSVSFVIFLVALGHALVLQDEFVWWYVAVASMVSIILAGITVGEGWGLVGKGTGQTSGFLMTFFNGNRGAGVTMISCSVVLAFVAIFLHGWNMPEQDEDLIWITGATYGLFVLLSFVGIGALIGISVHKENQKGR